jgi:hypothetical protein
MIPFCLVRFDLGDHTTNHITWTKAPVAAGTQIVFSILDTTGNEGWTGTVSTHILPTV